METPANRSCTGNITLVFWGGNLNLLYTHSRVGGLTKQVSFLVERFQSNLLHEAFYSMPCRENKRIISGFCWSRYDLRVRYIPADFLDKFQEDRTTLLYFYLQVCAAQATSLKAAKTTNFIDTIKTSITKLSMTHRCGATICTSMPQRSAMAWPCSWVALK